MLIPVVDLDLARVRAFVVAASAGHFGRGAAELGISQQALSKRITRLEDDLGVRLFLRTGRSVSLTEAGHRFVAPAQAAVAAGDRAVTGPGTLAGRCGWTSGGICTTRCGQSCRCWRDRTQKSGTGATCHP